MGLRPKSAPEEDNDSDTTAETKTTTQTVQAKNFAKFRLY